MLFSSIEKRQKTDLAENHSEVAFQCETLEERMMLATLTVNTTADNTTSGDGLVTLREAIIASNNDSTTDLGQTGSGKDTIEFAISGGGPFSISLDSSLPWIVDPVVIDATSQSQYVDSPVIFLDGSNAGNANGLNVNSGDTTIKGLAIGNFESYGIYIYQHDSNIIEKNHLGTDTTGSISEPNTRGGFLIDRSSDNEILDNVISGNDGVGGWIYRSESVNNLVQGNLIGVTADGVSLLKNDNTGIAIASEASQNTIRENVISGNTGYAIHIFEEGTTENVVAGNLIGTNQSGDDSIPNSGGVWIGDGAKRNVIGGTNSNDGNTISGNTRTGVVLMDSGTEQNQVIGNRIGTDLLGTGELPNQTGIWIGNGASSNIVGGPSSEESNVISGNSSQGIVVTGEGTNSNEFICNYVGVDKTGNEKLANGGYGLWIENGASNNIVGGPTLEHGNIISGNGKSGVLLYRKDTNENIITNNVIGLGYDGRKIPNEHHGVYVYVGPQNNQIGQAGKGNIISGNDFHGVYIYGSSASNNSVQGNLIGVTGDGQTPAGNGGHGILLQGGQLQGNPPVIIYTIDVSGSTNDQFDGTPVGDVNGDGKDNTILDAELAGVIQLTHELNALGLGDFVKVGVVPFESSASGMDLNPVESGVQKLVLLESDANNNSALDVVEALVSLRAGGNTSFEDGLEETLNIFETENVGAGDGNLIFLSDGEENAGKFTNEQLNLVNTLQLRRRALGIGGDSKISELLRLDPEAKQVHSTDELTQELLDFIGVPSDGSGNGEMRAMIGGVTEAEGNTIAFNGRDGILVFSPLTTHNSILGNRIFGNEHEAIDLGGDGASPNDAGDNDKGANGMQNFPEIVSARSQLDKTTISSLLESKPNSQYEIQFFATAADESDQQFLGKRIVTTDSNGAASVSINTSFVQPGWTISATATDADGNTSEFSPELEIDRIYADGTSSDDVINVDIKSRIEIRMGSDSWLFDRPVEITFNGKGGNDRIIVNGTANDEELLLRKGSFEFEGTDFKFEGISIEDIQVKSGGGADIANLFGTNDNERFYGKKVSSLIVGDGFRNRATGFERVSVNAGSGTDISNVFDTSGNDLFTGNPEFATITGHKYEVISTGFDRVIVRSTAGGTDSAILTGSNQADRFTGRESFGLLKSISNGYLLRAIGFDKVEADGKGGDDISNLFDSTGDDEFRGTETQSFLRGDTFNNIATNFERVNAKALEGGDDYATLVDGSGDDRFFGAGKKGILTAEQNAFVYYTFGFETVKASAPNGGFDMLDVRNNIQYQFVKVGSWEG